MVGGAVRRTLVRVLFGIAAGVLLVAILIACEWLRACTWAHVLGEATTELIGGGK
jgi:hypothetical protein